MLEMTGVDKRFGGVRALDGASLSVEAGEIHGLLGPNGSGKSTLNKVLAGTVRPDRATIRLCGQDVTIASPADARRLGVAAVYQQLSLIEDLSVARNLVLGVEATRGGLLRGDGAGRGAERTARDAVFEMIRPVLSPGVGLTTPVRRLPPGDRQLVEFAKAVLRRPRILVLDEATASLRSDQVEVLIRETKRLAAEGVAVVVVSHRMDEVRRLCSRGTILRNGQSITTVDMATTTDAELVDLMVGHVLEDHARAHRAPDPAVPPRLSLKGLSGRGFTGVSLDARPGEVIGLGGLQGQGQSELLHAVLGAEPARDGEVILDGESFRPRRPAEGMRHGVALVPGDRGSQGLMTKRSILENLSIASLRRRLTGGLWISSARERAAAAEQVEAMSIKVGSVNDPVSTLSGGNQQKVVLGKWLATHPRVVLLDDPTKGVDVGAKGEIYDIIGRMTDDGAVVVLSSSDDEELVTLADRVLVMYEGRVRSELVGAQITRTNLVEHAISGGRGAVAAGLHSQGPHAQDPHSQGPHADKEEDR